MRPQARSWTKKYWRAAKIPLGFATAFSAYVIFVETTSKGAALARLNLSLFDAIAFYYLTALAIGAVIALFGTWATTRSRGVLLGFASGALLAVVVNVALGPQAFGGMLGGYKLVFYMITLGLFPGAFVGAVYWKPPGEARDS